MNDLPPVSEWAVGEFRPSAEMVAGWRRFFTRDYWRFQWLCLRTLGRPMNIVSVGTLTVPDDLARRLNGEEEPGSR